MERGDGNPMLYNDDIFTCYCPQTCFWVGGAEWDGRARGKRRSF